MRGKCMKSLYFVVISIVLLMCASCGNNQPTYPLITSYDDEYYMFQYHSGSPEVQWPKESFELTISQIPRSSNPDNFSIFEFSVTIPQFLSDLTGDAGYFRFAPGGETLISASNWLVDGTRYTKYRIREVTNSQVGVTRAMDVYVLVEQEIYSAIYVGVPLN